MTTFIDFMRKVDGRKQRETTNSTTQGPRSLNLQGIIEFATGLGYNPLGLEERPGVPDHRLELFWAGYNRANHSPTMGMYGVNHSPFFFAGFIYQQQQRDTHSQQQDPVSPQVATRDGGSDGPPSSDHFGDAVNLLSANYEWGVADSAQPTVGGATPSAQSRSEPEGAESDIFTFPADWW